MLGEDDSEYDEEDDNILIEQDELLSHIARPGQDQCDPDHNWASPGEDFPGEHHCWLYHDLYDHTGLDWRDLLRIDMIWVDESRHIVSLDENVPPCRLETCPWHGSTSSGVRYLIQAAAGFVKEAGVEVGGELKYTLRM